MYQLDFYTVFLVSTAPANGQFWSVVGPVIWPWRCFSCGWNRSQAHRWFSTGQRAVPVTTLHETILISRESCLEIRWGPESKPSHCSICWLKHSSPGEEFCNTAEFGTVLHTIAQCRTFQWRAASCLSREMQKQLPLELHYISQEYPIFVRKRLLNLHSRNADSSLN